MSLEGNSFKAAPRLDSAVRAAVRHEIAVKDVVTPAYSSQTRLVARINC